MGDGKFNALYNIREYIGGGAFGRVYSATNKKGGRHVSEKDFLDNYIMFLLHRI